MRETRRRLLNVAVLIASNESSTSPSTGKRSIRKLAQASRVLPDWRSGCRPCDGGCNRTPMSRFCQLLIVKNSSCETTGQKSALGIVQISQSAPTRSVLQEAPRTYSLDLPDRISVRRQRASSWMRALLSVVGGLCDSVIIGCFCKSIWNVRKLRLKSNVSIRVH